MTSRTQALLASAIQAAGAAILGVLIADTEAKALAKSGSIEIAIDSLATRLKIKRAAPGLSLDSDAQSRLAISEVAAKTAGMEKGAVDKLIKDVIKSEIAAGNAANRQRANAARLSAIIAHLERSEPQRRAFLREVSRLYTQQRSQLETAIPDVERYERALTRLEDLYIQALRF
jgi:hypothetical protein